MTKSTPSSETGFDHGARLLLTAVFLTALLVLANTLYILAQPSDGWQAEYNSGELAHFLGDWPTPLQAGDTISTVAGIDLTGTELAWRQLPTWQEGATIPYTIARNGKPQTVTVQLHTLAPRQIAQAFFYVFIDNLPQLSWFVVGLIVFFLRPRNVAARLLLVAGASLTIGTRIGIAGTVTAENFVPRLNFYIRKKYNAQQVLDDFAQVARDETDMAVLQAELLRVVQEALQPEQISLWMKPTEGKKG